MDREQIEDARSKAADAVIILSPILKALNAATETLGVLSSAEKYNRTLQQEVETLRGQTAALEAALPPLRERIAAAETEAAEAEQAARRRVQQVQAEAEARVLQVQAEVDSKIAAAQTMAQVAEAGFTSQVNEARAEHDAAVAALFGQKQEKVAEVAELETQLEAAREARRKLAAALAG